MSLDALCKRYGVDNSKRINHSALIDCELLAKVYVNLTDQKEPTLDFQSKEIKNNVNNYSDNIYYKKVVKVTKEELNNHNEYLKKHLKKSFF